MSIPNQYLSAEFKEFLLEFENKEKKAIRESQRKEKEKLYMKILGKNKEPNITIAIKNNTGV